MPMFTLDCQANRYLETQRILALAAVIESLKGADLYRTTEEQVRVAALKELKQLIDR